MDAYEIACLVHLIRNRRWTPEFPLADCIANSLVDQGYAVKIPGIYCYVPTDAGKQYAADNIFA